MLPFVDICLPKCLNCFQSMLSFDVLFPLDIFMHISSTSGKLSALLHVHPSPPPKVYLLPL